MKIYKCNTICNWSGEKKNTMTVTINGNLLKIICPKCGKQLAKLI